MLVLVPVLVLVLVLVLLRFPSVLVDSAAGLASAVADLERFAEVASRRQQGCRARALRRLTVAVFLSRHHAQARLLARVRLLVRTRGWRRRVCQHGRRCQRGHGLSASGTGPAGSRGEEGSCGGVPVARRGA